MAPSNQNGPVAAEVEAAVPRSGRDSTALDGNAVQAHVSARRILHVSIFPTVTAPCEKRRAGELDMPERAAKTRRLSMTPSPLLPQAEVTGYPEGNSRAKPQPANPEPATLVGTMLSGERVVVGTMRGANRLVAAHVDGLSPLRHWVVGNIQGAAVVDPGPALLVKKSAVEYHEVFRKYQRDSNGLRDALRELHARNGLCYGRDRQQRGQAASPSQHQVPSGGCTAEGSPSASAAVVESVRRVAPRNSVATLAALQQEFNGSLVPGCYALMLQLQPEGDLPPCSLDRVALERILSHLKRMKYRLEAMVLPRDVRERREFLVQSITSWCDALAILNVV